jgi:uncharacterized protein YukE
MSAIAASWAGTSGASATATTPAPSGSASSGGDYNLLPHVVASNPSEVTGMDATTIMGILKNLNASEVARAGQAHLDLGQTLSRIADRLASNAQTLAQNWQGDAAQAAMNRFQSMHDQTAQLAQQATKAGNALSWLGNDVLPQFQGLPDPRVTSTTAHDEQTGASIGEKVAGAGGAVIGDGAGAVVGGVEHLLGFGNNGQAQANATAQKYLTALNTHLVAAYRAMPASAGLNPDARAGGSPAPVSVSPGGTGGAGGVTHAAPLTPVSGPGGTGAGGGGTGTRTSTGHSSSGGGAGTGGSTVGQVSTVSSPGAGGTGGQATGRLQGLTPTPGGTTTGTGGGVPGAAGPGPGPGTGPGSALPIPGGPVPGGGSGNADDSELVDESALGSGDGDGAGAADGSLVPEDAALLSGPDADTLPGVDGADGPGMLGAADPATATATDGAVADAPLGAQSGDAAGASVLGADDTGTDLAGVPMGSAGGAQQEKERRRQAWMNEDESVWGLPTDHVPTVIEGGG